MKVDMKKNSIPARRIGTILGLAGTAALLAGCTNPYDPGQRAVGGGLIGGGAGAAIGALAGGGRGAAIGALAGGVLGAGTGALTTPNTGSSNPQGGYYNQRPNNGYAQPTYPNGGYPPAQNGYYQGQTYPQGQYAQPQQGYNNGY